MNKPFTFILVLVLAIAGCQGCSFIKEHFLNKQAEKGQGQDQNQEEQRQPEQIPVNPQHS
ncbi:MAG: hypothetical protein HY094_06305 [Candidatus Melainabacteria bacterium]|nr:hypothetical protein [Candidatus Melainabacteria bacterium]